MIDFTDKIYVGANDRKSLYDCCIPTRAKAVVIFIHGYKGYKDWGCWNLVRACFIDAGYGFVKFNMSHNGGTVDQKMDFPDLEAFGRNTYSFELFDLLQIVDETYRLIHDELELDIPVYLLGHSRGGGVSVLSAALDERIRKVVSLAGISDISARFPTGDAFDRWLSEGVRYEMNLRTGQQMPIYRSLYDDFCLNADILNIEKAAISLNIPFLQIHGDMDVSVSISEGQALAAWTQTELKIIKGADHTFGSVQPWDQALLPDDLSQALAAAIAFFDQMN